MWRASSEIVGLSVWTGCGDELGRVVRVRRWPDGSPRELVIRQWDGSRLWFVEAEHVKAVSDHVLLKGPRDGFHLMPILPAPTRSPALPPSPTGVSATSAGQVSQEDAEMIPAAAGTTRGAPAKASTAAAAQACHPPQGAHAPPTQQNLVTITS